MPVAPHSLNTPQATAALVVSAMVGATLLVACGRPAPAAPQQTAATSRESLTPPFETADGFAWVTAACGSPSVMDASPNSWLPGASDVALCMTPPGRAPVLVGVYDDAAVSSADVTKIEGQRGYATQRDDDGRTWVFVVEGPDPAPLKPLEQYGFAFP